jgi:hypothetical protein
MYFCDPPLIVYNQPEHFKMTLRYLGPTPIEAEVPFPLIQLIAVCCHICLTSQFGSPSVNFSLYKTDKVKMVIQASPDYLHYLIPSTDLQNFRNLMQNVQYDLMQNHH